MLRQSYWNAGFIVLVANSLSFLPAWGATPTARDAFKLSPIQPDIDYDRPANDKIDGCKVEAFTEQGGWAVYNENGQLLRRFIDSNKDRKLDQWCYYKNGIEVYRDLDTNFNGKADQYRWLGTAGTRWGIDTNENGEIDSWKSISPEEVTAEVVAALREKNPARFHRLLLTADELSQLGVSARQTQDFRERTAAAKAGFSEFQKSQKVVEEKSEWLQFGASRPGIIPAGTDGSTKDLVIYDNVAAIVENDGKSSQLFVGTLVNTGPGWRVVDLPKSDAAGGTFISLVNRAAANAAGQGGANEQTQKLIDDLQRVDTTLVKEGADKPKLNAERANILEQLAKNANEDADKAVWVKQFADTVGAAVQSGEYPDGIKRLQDMLDLLTGAGDKELVPYVKFRHMQAEYAHRISTAKETEYAKVQEQWLKDLEQFVTSFPKSTETAEALLQLALGHEFSGSDEKAAAAYGRIVSDFTDAEQARKAKGAKLRLESIGQQIALKGKTTDGKTFDLAQYQGKTVLVQYWATWCDLCKQDMSQLKTLQAKYAPKGFRVVGVNLDNNVADTNKYLVQNPWPWPQLFEEGGMESRLANQLGIMTLPTMILIDKNGKVVRRNIHAAELDGELSRLLK